jgi:serine/threonine protein kinase/Tfp pilus assembly protein PilF
MIGTKLAHYEITSHLGSGGMGDVYQATDSRLGRNVAIKLFPEAFTHDTERVRRFEREARVLASLNHPNIAAIHGIDEFKGRKFLVMELVGGETLAERIQRGAVPTDEALSIVKQIAEGLESAHAKGIVHRDLKPANIKITKQGQVKLLDFGLAKVLAGEAADVNQSHLPTLDLAQTNTGVILGTAAYMSPEQAQGKPLDERSDIFSFGVVFYELLSGRRPFIGESTVELLSAVLRDDPPPINASEELSAIVRRCMAKRAADRFASIGDLKAALYRTISSAQRKSSIAVLPFANISGDKEQEYFSDGLAEEIINSLVKIPGLKVIARTSAFAFKGQNTDIRRIAEILGVTNVLEGSVRRAGNRIRVTAQLITAADGSHLWSERYDRQIDDLFTMQDEIAGAIASELKLQFAPSPAHRPHRQPNLNAYDAYLRYLTYQWGFTEESLRRSRECLEQAIALDPGFALPYAGLADHHVATTVANVRSDEAMPRARELARKALELDPDLPEAHGMLGIVAGPYGLDWKEAERRFRLAMAREPVPWHVRQWHAYFYLLPMGRLEEALSEMRRTIEDDPLSQVNYFNLAGICEALGLDKEAETAFAKMLELDPRFWWGWARLGLHHAVSGRYADARACADTAIAIAPFSRLTIGLLAGVLWSTGDTQQAEEVLARVPAGAHGYAFARTCFHLVCGDIGLAVEWAGKTIDERHPPFIGDVIRPHQRLFRTAPGWSALLTKMNLVS